MGTYAAAELLAQRFAHLVIVTPRERLGQRCGPGDAPGHLPAALRHGQTWRSCCSRTSTQIHALDEGRVSCRNVLNDSLITEIEDLALLTWSGSRAPDDELAAPLRAAGLDVI